VEEHHKDVQTHRLDSQRKSPLCEDLLAKSTEGIPKENSSYYHQKADDSVHGEY